MTLNADNIQAGLYAKLTGASGLMALITGVYLNEADDGAAYPYVIYRRVAWGNEDDFSHYNESVRFQIDVYAQDTSTKKAEQLVGPITKQVALALDNATLSITGYEFGLCKRESGPVTLTDDADREAGVEREMLEYRIGVSLLRSA